MLFGTINYEKLVILSLFSSLLEKAWGRKVAKPVFKLFLCSTKILTWNHFDVPYTQKKSQQHDQVLALSEYPQRNESINHALAHIKEGLIKQNSFYHWRGIQPINPLYKGLRNCKFSCNSLFCNLKKLEWKIFFIRTIEFISNLIWWYFLVNCP